MAMSFLQAFRAKESGAISWEEYIHHLFARWAGVKHEQDNVKGIYKDLRRTDPFGYQIWCLSDQIEPMRDTSQPEAVFRAYRRGTLDDIKNKFTLLQGPPAKGVQKSLALLALQERRPEVLKFCFDQGGFAFEGAFHEAADSVEREKDPQTFEVLEQSAYRKFWPREENDSKKNSDNPAAVFDKGGKYPVEW